MTQNPIQKDWTPKALLKLLIWNAQNAFSSFAFPQRPIQYLRTFAVHYTKGLQAEVNKALHKTKM